MPSIREVARLAEVSVATVSRVVNHTGPVRPETRTRVEAAIERLGYVPHGGARSLSLRRTGNVGVVLPDVHGAFFSELVRGIDVAARAAGYHLLVSGSHSDLAESAAVLRALHGRIDGLVLMMPVGSDRGDEWLRRHLPHRVPTVLLNHPLAEGAHDAIRVDNRHGARLAIDHLVELGHRRIAMICGPAGNHDAEERRLGYDEALRAARLPREPALVVSGEFDEASGMRACSQLAVASERPTAVFAANDAMAIGCLAALRERRLRVPEDLSLVGFDDIPVARYVSPALTTVSVPIAQLGRLAMQRLLAAAAEPDAPRHDDVLAPVLAVRGSTAPPAPAAAPSPDLLAAHQPGGPA
jgi:LacI family transcriptional regulator